MKPKPSSLLCPAKHSVGTPSYAVIGAALAFSFLYVSSVQATTRVWDGSATVSGTDGPGMSMTAAANWGTPGNLGANAVPVSGDTLEFSGVDTITTDLNMNGAWFASPNALAAVNVNQTNPLTFAAVTGTSYLRIASGGSFTVTNGAVSFNAGRIVFGVGTGTTESFTLTNNSTSPVTWGTGALTPIAVGTGPAAGGGRNMTFAGTGDWMFNSKLDGGIMAVVTKTGAGTLTLNASGNLLANIATTPLTLSQGSIVFSGAANLNSGAYASPIANSGSLVYSSSANQTFSGAITGTGTLVKNTSTSSNLTLSGVNNYSGATTLTTGTLTFAGDSTIGSLSVADQTTLGVKLTGPSVSPLKPSSLTLGAAPTDYSYLNVDFGGSTNPTVPVISAGTVNLNEDVYISLSGLTALTTSTNTIKLLGYSSLTGAGNFNLVTTSFGRATFELNQTATALYLNVTAAANIWKGTVNNIWDIGTLNWSLADGYLDGDTVVFNDTSSVTTVDIPSSVSPGGVTFSNSSAKTYTLTSGTGAGITGTSQLILNGTTGTVVITNTNTYTGTTTIGAGNTLRLGDGTTDGSIASTTNIINNGTLVYNRIGTTFTYNGVISGTGSLVKEGIGTQRLGVANTYSGGTTINGGDFQIDSGNAFGTGPLTLASGSITARSGARNVPNPATVSGNFTLNTSTAGGNALTLSGSVDLAGATRIITVANTGGSAITGVVSNGGLTKAGTGQLTLTGNNTYTGPTLISDGRLQIGNGGADGSTDATSGIENNAALTYNFTGQHTMSMPITGSGSLTKIASGIARFSNAGSSYTGSCTITAGALIKEAADSTTGEITVATDATFVLAGGISDGSGQTATITGPGNGNLDYFYIGSFNQRGALQAHTGNNTWAGNIVLTGTAGTGGNTRIGVQNGASLTLTGTISEAVAGMSPYFRAGDGASDGITLAGTCSWTGPTRIYSNGGSVSIAGNDKLPTTADLIVGAAAATLGSPTFDLAGFNQTVAGLRGATGTVLPSIRNTGASQSTLTLNPSAANSFPGGIQDNVKLVIGGTAPQTLAGHNTHRGDTLVGAGANLVIGNGGDLQFYPAANGVTNSVGGSGTLQYDGTLRIDVSGANSTAGNSWTLVNVGGLASPAPFGSTFAVAAVIGSPTTFTETAVNSGIWKMVAGGAEWTFTETDGKLSVAASVATPFDSWISTYFPGETNPAIIGKAADPDGDGINNLAEFALNGVPNNGANNGYHVQAVEDTNANTQKELTLTIAVRKGGGSPVFSGSPLSAVSDGVKYTIEGSLNLAFPTSAASEASPATGPGGLPASYEYRRFRLDASEGLASKGFLRVKTEPAP